MEHIHTHRSTRKCCVLWSTEQYRKALNDFHNYKPNIWLKADYKTSEKSKDFTKHNGKVLGK